MLCLQMGHESALWKRGPLGMGGINRMSDGNCVRLSQEGIVGNKEIRIVFELLLRFAAHSE